MYLFSACQHEAIRIYLYPASTNPSAFNISAFRRISRSDMQSSASTSPASARHNFTSQIKEIFRNRTRPGTITNCCHLINIEFDLPLQVFLQKKDSHTHPMGGVTARPLSSAQLTLISDRMMNQFMINCDCNKEKQKLITTKHATHGTNNH